MIHSNRATARCGTGTPYYTPNQNGGRINRSIAVDTTNRFRKTDELLPGVVTTRNYDGAGAFQNETVWDLFGGVYASGSFKSIHDVAGMSKKEYWEVRRKGGIINHPMQLFHEQRRSIPSNWVIGPHPVWGKRTVTGHLASGYCTGNPSGAAWDSYSGFVAEDKDRAITEAYAKMNSPDALAKVMYDEFGKTASFVAGVTGRAADFIEDSIPSLERRMARAVGPGQRLSTFNSWWLGARFGLRPMLADIDGAAKAVATNKPHSGKLLIVRGGVEREFSQTYSRNNFTAEGGVTANLVGIWTEKSKTSAGVIHSLYDLSESEYRAHALGLSADSTPSNIWEEIPYSWAVDYFYKVGQWISARTPNPFIRVLGDWVTQVRRQVNDHTMTTGTITINTPPVTTYTVGGGSFHQEIETVHRSTDVGVPSLPPSAGKPLTVAKAVDLAAAASSRLSKAFSRVSSIARI